MLYNLRELLSVILQATTAFDSKRLSPLVSSFAFSTEAYSKDERFAAYRAYTNRLVSAISMSGTNLSDFYCEDRFYDFNILLIGQRKISAAHIYRNKQEIDFNAADVFRFVFVTKGSTLLKETVSSGNLYVLDHSQLHQEQVRDMECIVLFMLRDELGTVIEIAEAFHGTAITGPIVGVFGHYLESVIKHLPKLTHAEVPVIVQIIRQLLTACLEPHRQRLGKVRPLFGNSRLMQAKRYISFRLPMGNVAVDHICQHVGVSRRQLYRLFEPEGGVASYIRKRRLQRAHCMLTNPNSSLRIYQVADLCGFSCNTEFSRNFKKAFGYTPREVAKEHRVVGGVEMQKKVVTLGDWFRRHG